MAETGWILVGAGVNVDDGGDTAWSNVSNIADGTDNTSSTDGPPSGASATQILRGTNFGIAIPPDAEIVGIEARVRRAYFTMGSANVVDDIISLVFDGAASGDNKASGDLWPGSAPENVQNKDYGGPTDKWGLTLTGSDVNSSTFGLQLKASTDATAVHHVAAIWINIHYNDNPGDLFLRPISTEVVGGWNDEIGGAALHNSIDEEIIDDVDYIRSSASPSADRCVVKLDIGSVDTGQEVRIRYRYRKEGAGTINLTVALESPLNTVHMANAHTNISPSFVNGTLSNEGVDLSGVDWSDAYLSFTADEV